MSALTKVRQAAAFSMVVVTGGRTISKVIRSSLTSGQSKALEKKKREEERPDLITDVSGKTSLSGSIDSSKFQKVILSKDVIAHLMDWVRYDRQTTSPNKSFSESSFSDIIEDLIRSRSHKRR